MDVYDVLTVSAAVALVTSSCYTVLLLLVPLLNFAVFSTVADFPTVCSAGPTADDIHAVPIVPAADVISDLTMSQL